MKLFLCSAFYSVLSSFNPFILLFSPFLHSLLVKTVWVGGRQSKDRLLWQGNCSYRSLLFAIFFFYSPSCLFLFFLCHCLSLFFPFCCVFQISFPLYSSVRKNLLLFVCMHVWGCFFWCARILFFCFSK